MGWPGPLTHRQFMAWSVWLGREWNNPDRHDHYLMRIVWAVEHVLAKGNQVVNLNPYKLKFGDSQPEAQPVENRPVTAEDRPVILKGTRRITRTAEENLEEVKRLAELHKAYRERKESQEKSERRKRQEAEMKALRHGRHH